MASKLKFEDVTIDHGTNSYSAEFNTPNGLSIELDARKMNPMSWGFMGGITYDIGERSIGDGTMSSALGNVNVTASSIPTTFQTTALYANAVYRWNQFYIPFGLSLVITQYSASPQGNVQVNRMGSSGGAQLGLGYYLDEHFIIEAYSRAISLHMHSTRLGGGGITYTDFNQGYLTNYMLTAKYIF